MGGPRLRDDSRAQQCNKHCNRICGKHHQRRYFSSTGAQKTSQRTNVSITVLKMTAISQVAASLTTLKVPRPNQALIVKLAVDSQRRPAMGSKNVPQNSR